MLIRGGVVVTADGQSRADVLVRDEAIAAVAPDLDAPAGARVLDAGGLLVLPGGIDVHTHFDQVVQGAHASDDFLSGGSAAAAGGITCHLDMAFQAKGGSLAEAVASWDAKADGRALIDYAYHLVIVDARPEVIAEMPALAEQGHTSFKVFMAYDHMAIDDGALFDVMRQCGAIGALPLVHGENREAINRLAAAFVDEGKTGPRWHAASRPVWAEAEAVERAIAIAHMAGSPLYVVHVSCAPALDAVRRARERGWPVYGETCAHYLVFDESRHETDDWDEAARYVCSPPLRSKADQEAIWDGLAAGTLQGVHSDHIPFDIAVRRLHGADDFRLIPNGIGGIEHVRPILWSGGVAPGRISPESFVALTATLPARLFGLEHKGRIAPGMDADIVLWDADRRFTVGPENVHSKADYVLYDGVELEGFAQLTMRRGEVVWDGAEIVGEPGSGRFVPRARFSRL